MWYYLCSVGLTLLQKLCEFTSIKSSKLFNEEIKNSKFKIIKNSGHEINIDNPKDLGQIISEFWTV